MATTTATPLASAVLQVELPIGSRVLAQGDLRLPTEPTAASLAATADVAATLAAWKGDGVLLCCGNLLAANPDGTPQRAEQALETLVAHAGITEAWRNFTSAPGRRVVVLAGWLDPEVLAVPEVRAAIEATGAEVAASCELVLHTATGTHEVLVAPADPIAEQRLDPAAVAERSWLEGIGQLEDPNDTEEFVTSRVTYRRLGRWLWVPPLVAVAVVLALSFAPIFQTITKFTHRVGGVDHLIRRVHNAPLFDRLLIILTVVLFCEVVVGLIAVGGSRRLYRGELAVLVAPRDAALALEPDDVDSLVVGDESGLDAARTMAAEGTSGLVVGGGLRAMLVHLGDAFYAACGGCGEVVRAHPARFGLPRIFRHHRQRVALELETGATLQVRLQLGSVELPKTPRLERWLSKDRVVKGYKPTAELTCDQVASWPSGASFPTATDQVAGRRRVRRVRRVVAAAIFLAGLADILLAIAPPLRVRIHVLEQLLPLGVAQTAGALLAVAGLALMMLARGVLRGQRRPWMAAVLLLASTTLLHLLHGVSLGGVVTSTVVLVLALVEWRSFAGATDAESARSGFGILLFGGLAAWIAAVLVVELTAERGQPLPSLWTVIWAVGERLVGISSIALPDRSNDWTGPVLLTVGISLVVVALYLLTRPVVDRRLHRHSAVDPTQRAAEEERARDLVRRHGRGTLDYFALRDDKQFFFYRDSLVAYAVFGGICIASPDPIGPPAERTAAFEAFRRFADARGWGIGVVGAAEEWLPTYLAAGMRQIYIGDEALVDLQRFSLAGGKMKGLRQACTRVERKGYRVEFLDPATVQPEVIAELSGLLEANRRGDEERGFSMMLGRMFDPRDTGLLLTVVRDEQGQAVAMCQFVPSAAISGYSLDLMRRDGREHPNGLLDFALCSTIEHLRQLGATGLSLNFAVLRSALEADADASTFQRIERWALLKLSGSLQIESLWRFNAKYEPTWQPRYIVYDSPEQFLPSVISFLRAESVSDVPVIGRLFTVGAKARPTSVVVGSGAGVADPPVQG